MYHLIMNDGTMIPVDSCGVASDNPDYCWITACIPFLTAITTFSLPGKTKHMVYDIGCEKVNRDGYTVLHSATQISDIKTQICMKRGEVGV